MKRGFIIAAMIISFLLALNAYGAEPTKGAGQCSYHGGLNKDTGNCNDGTAPGSYTGPSNNPAADPTGDTADAEAKAAAQREAAELRAKAKACKSATSAYNKLVNNPAWIRALDFGDGTDSTVSTIMDGCNAKWDDHYAPKLAACKTATCKSNITKSIATKHSYCEGLERWASSYEDMIDDAEAKMNAACN